MKQNLSNRLAGGGFWAVHTALLCVDCVQHMREEGSPNPAVNLTDTQVFVTAAVTAFNLFINANMDDNMRFSTSVQVGPDPKFADKYGAPITYEQWMELQRNGSYKQVDLWRNGFEAVYTVWTGLDNSGCVPPHIFATAVVRFIDGHPEVQNTFRTTNLAEAHKAHAQVIQLVRAGEL
jgi:hypothetical protein